MLMTCYIKEQEAHLHAAGERSGRSHQVLKAKVPFKEFTILMSRVMCDCCNKCIQLQQWFSILFCHTCKVSFIDLSVMFVEVSPHQVDDHKNG